MSRAHVSRSTRSFCLASAMLLIACSGSDGDDDDDDDDDDDSAAIDGAVASDDGHADLPDAGLGDPFTPSMGTILVAEQRGRFDGADEPVSAVVVTLTFGPGRTFHRETARQGECRLLQYEPAQCDPACVGICTLDGCVPFPTALDAGTVVISGTSEPLTIMRDAYGYHSGIVPVDLFDAGATIDAQAPGGADVGGFDLAALAPLTLETPIVSPTPLTDVDTEVTWTPADDQTAVFLTVYSANNGHGAPYDAIIECASPDDGAITVPGDFIAALGELSGIWCIVGIECPPAVLSRYHRDVTSTEAGEIELRVASERVFYVMHGRQ